MSTGKVRARVQDGVAILTLEQPPSNVLGPVLRVSLADAVTHFVDDKDVRAMVIASEGAVFSAGSDVRALEQPTDPLSMQALCMQIEDSPKPVIAALDGAALGIGADLALAAHVRVASKDARIGFPDIAIGLPPTAGGIQRLVRLVGPKVAIGMLASGKVAREMLAQKIGIIDRLVTGDVCEEAVKIAREQTAPTRTRDRRGHQSDGISFMDEVARGRKAATGSFALGRIVDCVEAVATVPFEAAMAMERVAWSDCLAHPEGQALRHLFVAERTASIKMMKNLAPTKKGQSLAARLFAAQDRAIVSMIGAGTTEDEIDAAMLEFGFAQGPFGGREPSAGPQAKTIQRRIVAAMMAEGARCLEQRLVGKSADIDAVAARSMGFPRKQGGPMFAATQMDLVGLQCDMVTWAKQDAVWDLPQLARHAILEAEGFAALDRR